MRSTQAGAGVAVEVLVKQQMVAPEGVLLKTLLVAEHRTATGGALAENADQALGQVSSEGFEGHGPAAAHRRGDGEVFPKDLDELAEGFDQEVAGRKPDRPAPVAIA